MPKQGEFENTPNPEIRVKILDMLGFKDKIDEIKTKMNKVIEEIMQTIKDSGRRSVLCENEDGDAIVVRLISSTEKLVIGKPPKKKKKVKAD